MAAKAKQPPPSNDPNRCSITTLDKFADTRKAFSQVCAPYSRHIPYNH
jgi:hypothetical protein